MTHVNCGIMKFLPIFFISQFSLIQDIDTDFEACRIVKKYILGSGKIQQEICY